MDKKIRLFLRNSRIFNFCIFPIVQQRHCAPAALHLGLGYGIFETEQANSPDFSEKRGNFMKRYSRILNLMLAFALVLGLATIPARATTFLPEEEAVAKLRQSIKERTKEILIDVASDQELMDCMYDVYNRSTLHTGVPDEGDYMYFNINTYSSEFSTQYCITEMHGPYTFLYDMKNY